MIGNLMASSVSFISAAATTVASSSSPNKIDDSDKSDHVMTLSQTPLSPLQQQQSRQTKINFYQAS